MRPAAWILALSLLMSNAPLAAQDRNTPPPEPLSKPDWQAVREQGESALLTNLFDPGSAVLTYTSGFQWGFSKPLIGRRKFGWVACGTINAKNRLGGYVGAQGFYIFVDASGAVTTFMQNEMVSTCDSGPRVELQPELIDTKVANEAANARLGVAEEIAKLAELKEKGLITEEEFQAQKQKLLTR